MGKVVVIFNICILLLLVGCNHSKVLQCEKLEKMNGLDYNNSIKLIFEEDKLKQENMIMTVSLDEQYNAYLDTIMVNFESNFQEYHNIKGIDYTMDKTSNGFKLNLVLNIDEMDDSAKEKLGFLDLSSDYDSARRQFKNEGYTCK